MARVAWIVQSSNDQDIILTLKEESIYATATVTY